jgi:hypothetical protein
MTTTGSIRPSVNNDSTEIILQKTIGELITNNITDGVATLSGGVFSNLVDPVNDTDIATKNYVDDVGGLAAGGVNTSVQYNAGGSPNKFGGDTKFVFDKDTTTLTSVIITDGTSTLTGGILSDLNEPTLPKEGSTKNYVDNSNKTSTTAITTPSQAIYSASQMTNGVIFRSGTGAFPDPFPFTDTTAEASDIIDLIPGAIVGSIAYFGLYFETTEYPYLFTITGGTGVTVVPDKINLWNKDMLTAKLIITSLSPSAVTLHVDNVGHIDEVTYSDNDPNWISLISKKTTTSSNLLLKNISIGVDNEPLGVEVLYPMSPIILTNQDHIYTFEEISKRLILRKNLTGPTIDRIESITDFITDDIFNIGKLTGQGIEFSIQNVDTTYEITFTDTPGWTIESGLIIYPGETGLFNIIVDSSIPTGSLYKIGIFSRNGV